MAVEQGGSPAGAHAVATIDGVVARMTAIENDLRDFPRDGVRHFNELYLAVTEEVRRGVAPVNASPPVEVPPVTVPPGAVAAVEAPAEAHPVEAPPGEASVIEPPGEAPPIDAPMPRISRPAAAAHAMAFEDEEFISRLDVVFANLYFKAYDAERDGAKCSSCWRPLFRFRHMHRSPLKFALCGMNAHICHDLAVALVETAEERNVKLRRGSPQHRDFQQVNAVLRQVESRIRKEFLDRALQEIDDDFGDLGDKVALWGIANMRDVAWRHSEFLWRLRAHRALTRIYRTVLSEIVRFSSNGLLA